MLKTTCRRSIAILCAAALTAGAIALMPSTADATADGDENPLHELMEAMDGDYRELRRQIDKPDQKDSTLALLAKLQQTTLKCLNHLPDTVKEQPSDKQALFALGYRRMMADLFIAQLDAEKAVREGQFDKAKELYRTMGVAKKDGHEQFQGEED